MLLVVWTEAGMQKDQAEEKVASAEVAGMPLCSCCVAGAMTRGTTPVFSVCH